MFSSFCFDVAKFGWLWWVGRCCGFHIGRVCRNMRSWVFILMEFVSLVWFGFYFFSNEGALFRIFF